MTRDEITAILRDRCCEHFGIEASECDESALFDDFQCDELDRIEMAIFVEDTFDVEFSDIEIDYRMITFGDLVNLVETKLSEKELVHD